MSAPPREPSGRQSGAGRLLAFLGPSARGSLVAVSALIASLLVCLVAYASVVPGGVSDPRGQATPASRPVEDTRISGHVVGLYPGGVKTFRVKVRNTGRRPLTVRSIKALVKNPSASCSAANIEISSYRGQLRLAPRTQRWVRLRIAMRPDAANACQRATFPLLYKARVTPAR